MRAAPVLEALTPHLIPPQAKWSETLCRFLACQPRDWLEIFRLLLQRFSQPPARLSTHGWAKGETFVTSSVWAAIAAGSAVIFTMCWPAITCAIETRNWSGATVALLGLLLFGSCNITGAIGSAAGSRINADTAETGTTDARRKAQASYDAARGELDGMKPARPVAELEPILAAAKPVCRIVVTNRSRNTVCAKPPALEAELGRAKRRVELEAKIERATADLAAAKPAKVANSDAKALASYLSGLGFDVDADRINKWLVLLAVLLVECGAGVSIVVGTTLAAKPAVRAKPAMSDMTDAQATRPASAPDAPNAEKTGIQTVVSAASCDPNDARDNASGECVQGERPRRVMSVRASDVAEWLRLHGGTTRVGMRRLGAELGCSSSRAHDEVRRLVNAGVVRATPGARGTLLELAMRPN